MPKTRHSHAAVTPQEDRNTLRPAVCARRERNASAKRAVSPGGSEAPRLSLLKKRRTCSTLQAAPCFASARGPARKRQRSPGGAEELQSRQAKRRSNGSRASVLAVSQGQGAASQGQRSPSPVRVGPLRLVLEPPSVPLRRRRLPRCTPLQVDEGNHLRGSVNGQECRVQLDTGAQITVVFWSTALRLGLIDGTEETVTMGVRLWNGPEVLEVVELPRITVRLGGGVRVVTPATVFPAWLEDKYEADTIILNAQQLRRGDMLQVFGPGGRSSLFVLRPERLLRASQRSPLLVPPDLLRVRAAQASSAGDGPMTVLLDTGANGVYVSAARRAVLQQGGGPLPRSLEVDVGDGYCMHLGPLETIPSNDHDFVFGTNVLCSYNAVLDPNRHTLDLRVNGAWRRLSMRARTPKS